MNRPAQRLAIYNPDQLRKDELLAQFVARRKLLDRLMDDLRDSTAGESFQHHLIVGPRGMGKTMFLRRLRYAIDDDPELSRRWLPLVFPEEQYNVARLSDLWVNCLGALGNALEDRGRGREAELLERLVKELPGGDEERRARGALAALGRWAEENHVSLVLLIDNIDIVLEPLSDDEQWALRRTLSTDHRLLFVGASARAIESTYRYQGAFYDFFRVHELRGLDLDEARDLVLNLATVRGTPQVAELLENDPARFQALHVLTGGNIRTLVILYEVLAQGDRDEIDVDLERLLDRHSPLYKARLDEMSLQARQIVDALALHWDPMTAAELARRVRLDVKLVSAQLNRLVQQQVVEQVAWPQKSKRAYQIADRLFNLWYLMRAGRHARNRLIGLVHFLWLFYEAAGDTGAGSAAHAFHKGSDAGMAEAITCLVGGDWPGAAELVRRAIGGAELGHVARRWPEILAFFSRAIDLGRGPDAVDLLSSIGDGDRWRPLREAVGAAVRDDPGSLAAVAPEVRRPAQEIFEQLKATPDIPHP